MISSTIVLKNSNNKHEGLATYNCAIKKRGQIVQASYPKHFQHGHQPSNKYRSFIRLPNNNIR